MKCFIPVPVSHNGFTNKIKFQLVRADKLKVVSQLLPSEEKITTYLRLKYPKSEKFNIKNYKPLSVKVSNDVFVEIIKEIRQKTNQLFVEKVITIVADSSTIPLFQIMREDSQV